MKFFHKKSRRIFLRKAAVSLLTAAFVLEPVLALAAEGDVPMVPMAPVIEAVPEMPVTPSDVPMVPSEPSAGNMPEVESPLTEMKEKVRPPEETTKVDATKVMKIGPDGEEEMSMLSGGSINYYPGFRSDTTVKNPIATPKVDESSGAMSYDYSIPTPKGRNGVEPDLRLHYSSHDRSINENILGLGWSLSIPYIERFATSGTQDLYSKFGYRSSLSGELVALTTSTFAARTERGDFLRYQLANGAWVVKDKKGLTYTFGNVSTTQVLDSTSSTKIFKWMLTEIRDLNGNYATYSYEKDQGQVYPDQITYTNATGTAGIYTVDFDREARPITNFTYRPGFLVRTASRISVIRISVSGFERYRATLGYDTGDNTTNSRIKTITERYTAPDGTQLTREPMRLGYEKNMMQLQSPVLLPGAGNGSGLQIAEINGDGIPDVVKSHFNNVGVSERKVYIGPAFGASSTWNIPTGFELMYLSTGADIGHRIVDMNGDGLADFLVANEIWYNGKSHPTAPTSSWYNTGIAIPVGFTSISGSGIHEPNGTLLVDLNKDGLTDILRKDMAYLFTGNGFATSTAWNLPVALHSYARDRILRYTQFVDLNGDGLTDLVTSSGTRAMHDDNWGDVSAGVGTTTQRFFLNTGVGWVEETATSTVPGFITNGQFYKNVSAAQLDIFVNSARFVDINADGLQDYIMQQDNAKFDITCGRQLTTSIPLYKHYLNTGNGFVTSSGVIPAFHEFHLVNTGGGCTSYYSYYYDLGTNVIDTVGDSVLDKANFNLTIGGTQFADNADVGTSDTLTKITYPEGGTTTIRYAGAQQQFSTPGDVDSTRFNQQLPLNQRVVDSILTDDLYGTGTTTRYSYEDGYLYNSTARPYDTAFVGFGKVKITSLSEVRTVYFHQGNATDTANGEYDDSFARIGLPYKTVISSSAGDVYSTELMKYDETQLIEAPGEAPRVHVSLGRKVAQSYDGGATHRDVAETFSYDVAGNLIDHIQYGEVTGTTPTAFTDITGDDRRTTYQYAVFSGGVSSTHPSRKIEFGFGTSTRSSIFTYDGQTTGLATLGNLTQILTADASSTLRISTSSTYSSLGLMLTQTDARWATTTFAYDSAQLFSVTTTNALGQYVTSTYDYFFGQPTRIRDENGQIKRMVYDPSGRPFEFYAPDATGTEVKNWDIVYADTPGSVSQTKNIHYSGSSSDPEYTYYDGFGRLIQTKKTGWPDYWFTVSKKYDGKGRESWNSVPYIAFGSPRTTLNIISGYQIVNSYDPMGRVVNVVTGVGTTQHSYSLWSETVTDAMGKTKTFTYDAYGRLNTVVERNTGVDYTTRYTYDHFGNLLKITDANGDVRNFTYDALGRRTKAEDVHTASDTTFLQILYAYDRNGNLTVEHRSDKTSVGYTYDLLNRPLTMAQNSSTVYTLTYDSCTVGLGRLCSESSSSYSRSFAYDPNGNAKAIDFSYGSTTYSELFVHDRAGRVTSSTLADGTNLTYGYDDWQFRSLHAKEAAATSSKAIITNITYDADQLPFITWFGNGAKTYSQRDPEKLYRVNGLRTSFTISGPPDGPFFQELEFYYDANNRIVEMRELDATSTKRRVQYSYDDLDRLTTAHATTTGDVLLYKEKYSYDPVGNFLSTNLLDVTGTSTTSTYSYSRFANANSHAVTNVSSTVNGFAAGNLSIGYDMRGNVTSTRWFNASGTETLAVRHTNVYNAANDMTAMGLGSATQTQLYLYDRDGLRFTQKAATSTLVYASPQFNATINASGTRIDTEKHLSYGAQLLATIDGTGIAARILYQHPDHLSGANAITNEAKGFEEVLDYMPFGAIRVDAKLGSWSEQRKYAGHDFDDSSGYSYMKARYYEPSLKRFLGQDSVFWSLGDHSMSNQQFWQSLADPQQLNSYTYARNNPITNIDPDGHSAIAAVAAPSVIFPSFAGVGVIVGGTITGTTIAAGGIVAVIGSFLPIGAIRGADDSSILTADQKASIQPPGKSIPKDTPKGERSKPTTLPAPKPEDIRGRSAEEVDKIMKDKGWKGEPSSRGGGTRYPNINKRGEQVRIQPGNPNNPDPVKRGPYGRISTDGKTTPPIPLKGNPTLNP